MTRFTRPEAAGPSADDRTHARVWQPWRSMLLVALALGGVSCDRAIFNPCGGPLAAGSDTDCRLTIGGVERAFFIHVSDRFDGRPLPLVLDLHGTGSSRDAQRRISGWVDVADREGLIIAHPQALPGRTGRTQWNAGDCCEEGQTADDLTFLRQVVLAVRGATAVDGDRIFATGLSTGGVMSHFLGCRAADVFAGIAPLSFQLSSNLTCDPPLPMNMIEFHAPTDRQRSFDGHTVRRPDGSITRFPSAPDSAARWAAINTCDTRAVTTLRRGGSSCVEFPACASARVGFCAIDGSSQVLGGHVLYTNDDDLDLAEIAWDFLSNVPRRSP